jgi:hypothetical protein
MSAMVISATGSNCGRRVVGEPESRLRLLSHDLTCRSGPFRHTQRMAIAAFATGVGTPCDFVV